MQPENTQAAALQAQSQENPTSTGELAIVERKIEAWKKFATEIHQTEQQLQLSCSALVTELSVLPVTADDLPEAEAKIKRIKAERNLQVEFRKTKTSKLDTITKRLMVPETSVLAPIAKYESAILSIKQAERDRLTKIAARNNEIAMFRERFSNHISQTHADFESQINSRVVKCLEKCLKDNIKPEELPVEKMKSVFNLATFATNPQSNVNNAGVILNADEVFEIWKEIKEKNAKPAEYYLDLYHKAIDKQFEFYSVALKNKEAALNLAKDEAAKNQANITANQANATVAAKLETLAVPATETTLTGKQIKKVWKLDMEDNENNALIILIAFTGNWAICKAHIRVKSMFALSIGQMGAALEAARSNDEKFDVSGLVWKQIDKL